MENLNIKLNSLKCLSLDNLQNINGGTIAAVFIIGIGLMTLGYTVGKDLGKLWAQHDKANN